MDQPKCGFTGCHRLAGHKGSCVGLPDVAKTFDDLDAKERERVQFVREHPVQSFADIVRCGTCYALVFEDDEELHWEIAHGTP